LLDPHSVLRKRRDWYSIEVTQGTMQGGEGGGLHFLLQVAPEWEQNVERKFALGVNKPRGGGANPEGKGNARQIARKGNLGGRSGKTKEKRGGRFF